MINRAGIPILVTSSRPIVLSGLVSLLEPFPDITIVGTAESAAETVTQCAQFQPEIVVSNLLLDSAESVTLIAALRSIRACIKVMMIACTCQPELVRGALRAGALSYLLMDATADELVMAIRSVRRGHATFSPQALDVLAQSPDVSFPSPEPRLTTREIEVLTLISQGMTNLEIGTALNISKSTAQFHVHNLLAKLGVSTRVEAAVLGTRHTLATSTGDTCFLSRSRTGRSGGVWRQQCE